MLAQLVVSSALFSSSFAALLQPSPSAPAADAVITPGPQIELLRKQNDLQYMGWIFSSGTLTTDKCDPGHTYYQASGQWGCCSTAKAGCLSNIAIGCANGNMIFRVTATGSTSLTNTLTTRPCTSIWTAASDASFTACNTALMFENERDTNPKVNVVCGVQPQIWSYYRQQPAITTSAIISRPTPSSPSPGPTTTTNPGLQTPAILTATPEPEPEKKESKAWIAGAVVGPLLGLALIGLGAFFFIRRKKNKTNAQHVAPATGSIPPAGATAYQQNTYPTEPGSPQPPQYYPPMQQNAGAAPFGVAKQDGFGGPQSPMTSQGSQSPYGAPQQWQQPAGQPVYGVPSPSMSPQPQTVQPAPYVASESRPFSSELEGSYAHGQPQVISVQPKQ
jgi:LPXTG-motif cell wall-anchored protein